MRLSGQLLRVTICSCLILSLTGGCATYDTQKNISNSESNILGKEYFVTVGDIDFRCCSLAAKDTSQKYLGIDPASTGMVPLLLKVRNNGSNPVKVDLTRCFLANSQGSEIFKALALSDATERARRSDAAVVGATLAFGMIGGLISGSQTAQANRTLEQDYYDKYFKPTLINTGSEGQGVIFFDTPEEKQSLIRYLVITTIDIKTMDQNETRIQLPR